MSESRKSHFTVDGGQEKEDDHAASYKPIPEADTAAEIEYIEADTDYIQLEGNDTMETDENDEIWDNKSITTMLKMYLENVDKFRNPKVRKKNLWTDIAEALGKSHDSCDKKFRNLKQTYIRLVKKRSAEPEANIRWPYFKYYDDIFCINGEYQPEIQQKIFEVSNENVVAKTLLSIKTGNSYATELSENGHSSSGPTEMERKKQNKKRQAELKKVTMELRDRQRTVEEKLDRLMKIVEESNNIQRKRNELFEQFLEKLTQNR